MKRANQDIRIMLDSSGVKQWELAKRLGYSDCWFSVKMRSEFSEEDKLHMFGVISEIAGEKEADT